MTILNIAGYRFIELNDLTHLHQHFLFTCKKLSLKGTILLSNEGININLSGNKQHIESFKVDLTEDCRFADFSFHESFSTSIPFQRLKVKIKKEIITFRKNTAYSFHRAPTIAPATLKMWLDQHKDINLLDTRNNYEIEFGTFENAINPNIAHFTELAHKITTLDRQKPVVMFCTGGIRCEKAAVHLQSMGFQEVYQLEGGILGYFKEIGNAHWKGSCFVFDDRITVNPPLNMKI